MSVDLTIRVAKELELQALVRQAQVLAVELFSKAPSIEAYALEGGVATPTVPALIGNCEGVLLLAWYDLDDRVALVTTFEEDAHWVTASVGATRNPTELTLALLAAAALEILTNSDIEDRGGEWSARTRISVANLREVMSHIAGGSFEERCQALTTALGVC